MGESVQLLLLVGLVGRTLAQQPTSEQGEEIVSLTFNALSKDNRLDFFQLNIQKHIRFS